MYFVLSFLFPNRIGVSSRPSTRSEEFHASGANQNTQHLVARQEQTLEITCDKPGNRCILL